MSELIKNSGSPLIAPETMSVHERKIIEPIINTGPGFKLLYGSLILVCLWALYAYIYQVTTGLGVTGMYRPVYWGIYITNFVFFIGVSHAGTLISAILRLTQAEWRRSVTRMAEVITVLVIAFGAVQVIIDLGRPDRLLNILLHPHFRSPLLWDVCSITVYLVGSTTYLILPLLPDIVIMKKHVGGWRGPIYNFLTMGYADTPSQRKAVERWVGRLMVIVVPIAVSVHTVISWIFAMTIQPMWHSTIFGPYFVAGAIYSGVAAILTFMILLRKAFHLEEYFRVIQLEYLSRILLVMTLFWFYFTFAEYLTTWYGNEPDEMAVFNAKLYGRYAVPFWTMVTTCFVIPFGILSRRATRNPTGILIASISVNIGMYLERYTIIVPTLINARIHLTNHVYSASWVEWSILAGTTCGFLLLYLTWTKILPIVSIWEVEEGAEMGATETAERIRTYYPEPETQAEVAS